MNFSNRNILLVANWESDVGYAWWLMENFWLTISAHFQHVNIECYLIYPKITKIPQSIQRSNIDVYQHDFRDHSINNLKKLTEFITINNIKYIYLTDSPSYSWIYLILRFYGIRSIVIHDHTPGERTRAKSWKKLAKSIIQRIPLITADHFLAVTDFVYNRLIDVSCIPQNKCSVVPNGIQPIDLASADLFYAQKCFSIPDERIIVVSTGRATYYKGIDFFIHCADELINKRQYNNLHFLFCGDGPDIGEFKCLVAQLNLENNFTFTGKRTDVRKILPSCHIGFHASKGEVGYSLSILEYMSAGLATIVPDNPSTSEATIHNKTGLLYKSNCLRDAIDMIICCLPLNTRKTLSSLAVQAISEQYNIKLTNRTLITVLKDIFI